MFLNIDDQNNFMFCFCCRLKFYRETSWVEENIIKNRTGLYNYNASNKNVGYKKNRTDTKRKKN